MCVLREFSFYSPFCRTTTRYLNDLNEDWLEKSPHTHSSQIMPSHHHHPRGGGGLRPLVQVYLAKFVLEVLGGGGAIWGPAETFSFRTNDTTEFWQSIARLVSVLFAIRWVLQLGQELCAANRATCSDHNNNKTIVSFVHTLVTRFVLQVLGAIGAVWGFFECLTLRTDETQEFWRQVCFGVGILFGGRFLSHMYQYWQDLNRKATTTVHRMVEVTDTPQLVSLFAAKLVLEVFGAGTSWLDGSSHIVAASLFLVSTCQSFVFGFWYSTSRCHLGMFRLYGMAFRGRNRGPLAVSSLDGGSRLFDTILVPIGRPVVSSGSAGGSTTTDTSTTLSSRSPTQGNLVVWIRYTHGRF